MSETHQTPAQFDPAITALLAAVFKLAHLSDESAVRGADNAMRYVAAAPIFAFDPTESRAISEGSKEGTYYVTDGLYCTCKSKGWCKHAIAHRLKLAELALTDPAALVRLVVEQAAPAVVEAEIAAAGSAPSVIGGIVVSPFDLSDDAAYADLVAGIAALSPRSTVALSPADALVDELYP